jgi:hypothetical protein
MMPKASAITGRISSIRNAFVAAIIPKTDPIAAEIREVLQLLEMSPNDLKCAYCGDKASEWDHLRPLVVKGRPTGYPTSIKNLVPACGKCNQSKSGSDWKAWMRGPAKKSPASRGIKDLDARIMRLEAYENWAKCVPIDVTSAAEKHEWEKYYALQEDILRKMSEAQQIAKSLAMKIKAREHAA